MGGVETGGQDSSFGGEDCSAKYCALHHDTLDICNTPCLSFLHIPAVHLPFTDAIWNGHTDCQISISLSNELCKCFRYTIISSWTSLTCRRVDYMKSPGTVDSLISG